MIQTLKKLNIRRGLFRLWLIVSVIWCLGVLAVTYNQYQDRKKYYSFGSTFAIQPYMERHCENEVRQGSFVPQKDYNNCLNSIILKRQKEEIIELVYIVLSLAFGIPLFIFGVGFTFFRFQDNGYNKKLLSGFVCVISIIIIPLKWVAEGFSKEKANKDVGSNQDEC